MAGFEIPEGWTARAYRYALDPTQRRSERSYGMVETELTPSLNWSLAGLRKEWNSRKHEVAPWWPENSKAAYNTGLDALARGLAAWSASRKGQRAGAVAGFPRFKSVRSRRSVRFTTGTIRVEESRHHVTLPRLGRVRTHESTRKLTRRIGNDTARILSATLSETPSKRWARTWDRIGATHAHAAAVRRDVLHKATTGLARRHSVLVVERLNVAGMCASGGGYKRGLNRALVVADRMFECEHCGVMIDRDRNAAINLARLGETPCPGEQGPAGSGPVAGRGAIRETEPARVGEAGGCEASTPHRRQPGQTGTASPQGEAARWRALTFAHRTATATVCTTMRVEASG
ncbi:zinc ribbon domain-containing protein [Nocardia sp. SSK8]|uniref:zinc ribbon domain-containing protein n=1 Tax=Nocardia sp. SSK8 TaxID=3120154 RepID=UPI00300ADF60